MKKKTAILGAWFLITLLFVGFSVAEPIRATPGSLTASESDDPILKGSSLDLVNVFDVDDGDDDDVDDGDDDDVDDGDDDDVDDGDEEEEHTKEQDEAEAKIKEAEDKIADVEDEIAQATGVDSENIEEAEDELEDAREHLAEAEEAFEAGDYDEAYEEAEEAIEECEEALEELNETETDDIDDDESAAEDAAERNLQVTVLLNDQDATGTSSGSPMLVSGDATIEVIIENHGPTAVIIEEIEIKTSTGGIQVSSFELSGATLSSGTEFTVTNEVGTGVLGALAELFSDPLYESKVEIKMEGGWDYELVVYWQAAA